MKTYTVTVEEDPTTGDTIVPFPDEMLEELGWLNGDNLDLEIKDGEAIITNLSWIERNKS
jgi:hypothetical protein